MVKKELNCVFIRTNPNEKNVNIFKDINKIRRHIKKSMIVDLSKRLLGLEFKSNHSIKSKCISCQKMFYQITKNEKHTIKS